MENIWLIIKERSKLCLLAVPAARGRFSREVAQRFLRMLLTVIPLSSKSALWAPGATVAAEIRKMEFQMKGNVAILLCCMGQNLVDILSCCQETEHLLWIPEIESSYSEWRVKSLCCRFMFLQYKVHIDAFFLFSRSQNLLLQGWWVWIMQFVSDLKTYYLC